MLGYLKAAPTTYVLHYSGGRLRREGPGLAFASLLPTSTIVSVPLASADLRDYGLKPISAHVDGFE